MLLMNKADAINLLGGTPAKAANALGYSSVHAIYMWPDVLPLALADRVRGAAMRAKENRKRKQAPALTPYGFTATESVSHG